MLKPIAAAFALIVVAVLPFRIAGSLTRLSPRTIV